MSDRQLIGKRLFLWILFFSVAAAVVEVATGWADGGRYSAAWFTFVACCLVAIMAVAAAETHM